MLLKDNQPVCLVLTVIRNIQALLRSEEKPEPVSVSEPAGSEAAKFRLWVKSKGLALTRPGDLGDQMEVEEEEGPETLDTPLLFVPTGTDKVSQATSPSSSLN